MSFKPTIGAAGNIHPSEAEALLSFPFHALGIVAHDHYYQQGFTDTAGTAFRAKSDFKCPITNIYIETKSGSLNGLRDQSSAITAQAGMTYAVAAGKIKKEHIDFNKLKCSWSASVPKFKAVQNQLAAAGGCVIMVFDKKPHPDTVGRLERSKAFWCVFGDSAYRTFMSFRTLAKHGFQSTFNINGHTFASQGGVSRP